MNLPLGLIKVAQLCRAPMVLFHGRRPGWLLRMDVSVLIDMAGAGFCSTENRSEIMKRDKADSSSLDMDNSHHQRTTRWLHALDFPRLRG